MVAKFDGAQGSLSSGGTGVGDGSGEERGRDAGGGDGREVLVLHHAVRVAVVGGEDGVEGLLEVLRCPLT